MSLQLIIGGSGSGKSYELYKHVIEASVQSPGTQFLVIVPEQFTMQTQKELVHMHPKKGIFNIDILSFQRLSHRIFEEVGEDKRTVLEELGKTLLIRRTATKHQDQLTVLRGNLKKKGYLAEVKSLISELTQYDVDEDKMERMLQVAREKPQLYYKLQDIQTIYHGFSEELAGVYITAEETLEALCQVADRSKILKDCVIALDGFTGFTPIQQKLLKKLMVLAKEVYVTVTIDPKADLNRIYGEHELFYLSKKTIRSLTYMAAEAGCEICEPQILSPKPYPRYGSNKELAVLEERLFRGGKREQPLDSDISKIEVHVQKDAASEVRFVGRTIKRLIREGYRYADIAIIAGNLESYANDLRSLMQEYEVPIFMDSTRAVFCNPLIEFIRAVLELPQQDYSREGVFRYLRTGMCNISPEDIDQLENYCLAAGIKGYSKWKEPFKKLPMNWCEKEKEKAEKTRKKVIRPLTSFQQVMKGKTTTEEKTRALYELIAGFEIQEQLEQYEKHFLEQGKPDLEKEYSQVYALVMGLFDKIVELLGTEVLSLKEYAEILETGFEEMKIGIIPPTTDLVQVGNIERTRLKDIKVLFFMGLNDGFVPATKAGGGLLSDMERELLLKSEVDLAPTTRQDSYIQRFYLYLNLTKPSEKLYLSYSRGTSTGTTLRPSAVVHSLQRLFPRLEIKEEPKELTELVSTQKTGMYYLVEGMSKLRLGRPEDSWVALFNWYRRQENYREEVEHLLDAVYMTFTEEGIGKEAARELYGEILVNSVSRLEQFAGCAFSHFLQYGLGLQERDEYSFRFADFGTIVHRVVELFSKAVEEEGYQWKTMTGEERERLVDACVDQVTGEYGQEILKSTSRNAYLIERIRRIMRRTVWALQKQIQAGSFLPSEMEVSFANIQNLDAVNIALTEEEKMRLKGRIDRIDTCEKENQIYVKVIDYKSGSTTFDLVALYHGLQLQLVVYLNAAMQLEGKKHEGKEMIPAGIFYYHVKDPVLEMEEEVDPEQMNENLLKELRLNGLVNEDPEVYREMDAHFEKNSSVIPIALKNDGTLTKASKTASKEQFRILSSYVNEKMRSIGKRIMNGEIAAVPYERDKKLACDFCIYREICRYDRNLPGTHTRRLREYTAEEIWEQMEIQTNGNHMDTGTT